jgi:hypothetical protein
MLGKMSHPGHVLHAQAPMMWEAVFLAIMSTDIHKIRSRRNLLDVDQAQSLPRVRVWLMGDVQHRHPRYAAMPLSSLNRGCCILPIARMWPVPAVRSLSLIVDDDTGAEQGDSLVHFLKAVVLNLERLRMCHVGSRFGIGISEQEMIYGIDSDGTSIYFA